MNRWLEKASENLFEAGVEKTDFNRAKEEWIVTERVIDAYRRTDVSAELPACELCLHERIRWQFEIRNTKSGRTLLVGSTCITQFDFPVLRGSRTKITGTVRDRILARRVERLKAAGSSGELRIKLEELAGADTGYRPQIEQIARAWTADGKLSPSDAWFIASRCEFCGIELPRGLIDVSFRSETDRLQIRYLTDGQLRALEPHLTQAQKRIVDQERARREKGF